MIRYKGCYIWHNPLQGWMVQEGYAVLKVAPTLRAAKAWVTRNVH